MSLPISSIITVNIAIEPAAPQRQGFGTAAAVTNEELTGGGVQPVPVVMHSSASDVLDYGFPANGATHRAATAYFAQSPSPTAFATIAWDTVGGESLTEALEAAKNYNDSWYGVLLLADQRDQDTQIEAATWVESNVKVLCVATADALTTDPSDNTSMAARLNAGGYTRTMCIYTTQGVNEYPDAAALGVAFTTNFNAPNTVKTLKFKTLSTITPELITVNDKAGIDAKRANVYAQVGNTPIYQEGWMSSELFFDERHGVDWLTAEIETNVFSLLVQSTTKVPLTDKGGAAVAQQVTRALDAAVANGLLAPGTDSTGEFLGNGYRVEVQKVADMNPSDISARRSPVVSFVALLAGAIHFVQIEGVIER